MPHDWVRAADPSWYPHVLQKLQEKYPEISDNVWSEAIEDYTREQTEKHAKREFKDHAVWGPKGRLWYNRRPPSR